MKHVINYHYFALIAALVLTIACNKDEKKEPEKPETFDVDLVLPGYVEIAVGENLTLAVKDGKAPLVTDIMQYKSAETGAVTQGSFISVNSTEATVGVPKSIVSGKYSLTVKRDSQKKALGAVTFNIIEKKEFTPSEGTTIYGKVTCAGAPLNGVVVSDGVEVVRTGANGYYEIKSAKERGYVFVSIPSGYEATLDGVLPRFSNKLVVNAQSCERSDFELIKADSQDSYTMLFFGDMHLTRTTNYGDIPQFQVFAKEAMDFVNKNPGKEYAMTLGDMTWDIYWATTPFSFPQYLELANSTLAGLPIFHTMGNHDNNYKTLSDWDAEKDYVEAICPTYYSFNIGSVHYVVLDDINCSGYDGTTARKYATNLTGEQIMWLSKDLQYVLKSNPVVVTSHSPFFKDDGNPAVTNASTLVSCFEGFETVHFVTGHTHECYNVDRLSGGHYFEHNAGAVCATWWLTGLDYPGLYLSRDGSTGGYTIMRINGKEMNWQYKSTSKDITHQFRSYDRNCIDLSTATRTSAGVPDKAWNTYTANWTGKSTANEVYINVWNWDPSWKVEVTEGGKQLAVSQVTNFYDPLHILAYSTHRPEGAFSTHVTKHAFKVKASSANSTLEIKVTDRFGNVYTESMKRPKAFSIEAYNK